MGQAIKPIDGFKFILPSNDHRPNHVHVSKGNFEVRIDISGNEALLMKGEENSRAASDAKMRRKALTLVNNNLRAIQKAWEDIHHD